MTPTAQLDPAAQARQQLDNDFPKLTPDASNSVVIKGLETLNAPAAALGVTEPVPPAATPPAATPSAAATPPVVPEVPAPGAPVPGTEPKPLTIEERLAQDEELKKFLEAEKSRAVTGYIKKRDADELQKARQAGAEAEQQKLIELAKRAKDGDEAAKEQLLQSTSARLLGEYTAAEVTQGWWNEMLAARTAVVAEDPEADERLQLGKFKTITEFVQEANKVATERALRTAAAEIEQLKVQHAAELEKLSEAKAIDIVAGRRQGLPASMTDLNQPAAGGGGFQRQGTWKTLSEASKQWNDGSITDQEYKYARALYDDGRLTVGSLGID